jgi:hypothetical protein
LQRIPQYLIFAGLGVIGGGMGTALAIGLAIVVQARVSATTTLTPEIIPLTLAAVLLGVGISGALAAILYRIWLRRYCAFKNLGLHVLLLVSVLTSLLQTVLLTHGL